MKWIDRWMPGVVIAGCVVIVGCGIEGLRRDEGLEPGMHETVDPFEYGDEFSMTARQEESEQEPREEARETVAPSPVTDEAEEDPSDSVRTGGLVTGYRVQLGIFEVRDNAYNLADYARTKLQEPVYVEFDPPFYRVRVGDFTEQAQAQAYARKLKELGFRDVLWVKTRITDHQ